MSKDQDSNGYFYGRSLRGNQSGPDKHVTVFRFMIKYVVKATPTRGPIPTISYDWHILTFVTHWESEGKARLLCFNSPQALKDMIKESLSDAAISDLIAHPFAFLAVALEHVAELYDQAIWRFRDFVRDTEKQRLTIEAPQADYTAMHELARHVMHSSEVIDTALNVTDQVLGELTRWQGTRDPKEMAYDPGPDIRHKKSTLQFMHNRSKALEERLKNEINLAFHITSQHSNLISAKIAHAAQVDSRAMKTISILGLVFLPGTFISAIFSMSFFNFDPPIQGRPGQWAVSEKFWMYWVVAIPVTALTVVVWWKWQSGGMPPMPEVDVGKKKKKERDIELQNF